VQRHALQHRGTLEQLDPDVLEREWRVTSRAAGETRGRFGVRHLGGELGKLAARLLDRHRGAGQAGEREQLRGRRRPRPGHPGARGLVGDDAAIA
jgi:hypothetical protein